MGLGGESITRERLYKAYIEELMFFNPMLRGKTESDVLADFNEVSQFSDLTWIDLYDGIEVVGFLLIATGKHCPKEADYLIMEAYTHPNHRGKGIMQKAVQTLFQNNPGKCGLFILQYNASALKFWDYIKKQNKVTALKTPKMYDSTWCRFYLWSVP